MQAWAIRPDVRRPRNILRDIQIDRNGNTWPRLSSKIQSFPEDPDMWQRASIRFQDIQPAMLLIDGEKEFNESGFSEYVKRRAAGEPCAYITGRCEFMSLDFFVDENVLVPRQDTETLCEAAIAFCGEEKKCVLDMCTGSGCIAVSGAAYCKNTSVYGIDISEKALCIARKNAEHNNAFFKA